MYLISAQTDVRARLWRHRSSYRMTTHAFLLSLITTAFHSSYWPGDNDWRSITWWWYPKGWLQVLNLRFITWMFLSILLFMGWCALRFNRYKSQVIDTSTVQISSTFFVLDFKGILSWSLNLPFLMYIITVGSSGFNCLSPDTSADYKLFCWDKNRSLKFKEKQTGDYLFTSDKYTIYLSCSIRLLWLRLIGARDRECFGSKINIGGQNNNKILQS